MYDQPPPWINTKRTVNWTFHGDALHVHDYYSTIHNNQSIDSVEYIAYTWADNALLKNHRAAETLAISHEKPPLEWLVRVGQITPRTIQAGWLPGMSSQRG